ncbi:MAG: methionyl-tRNA formyltransferase [Finegoldia sp.]|nr:methionyl-tRNA formyltransferase [Finegoldia sp.]
MNKVIFMGSPDFAIESLKKLNEDDNIEVVGVISQPDRKRSRNKYSPTPVKEKAIKLGLDVVSFDDVNTDEALAFIEERKPDFLIDVAFGQMIKKRLLETYKDRIVNIHPSLLPKYRGASPLNHALLNGDEVSGVTIMLVDEGMDTGNILKQEEIKIGPDDMLEDLHDKAMVLGADMLVDVINNYDYYYKNRQKQDDKRAVTVGKITKDMGKIDFNLRAREIYNKYRALTPWPGVYFNYEDKNIKIHKMDIIEEYNDANNGKVISVSKDCIKVAVEDGYIAITRLQLPNKKPLDVSDFLNGNDFPQGVIL